MTAPVLSLIMLCVLMAIGLQTEGDPRAAPAIREKTLVVWVAPASLVQQGTGALTIIDRAEHFDSITFGEIAAGKWMPGSDYFRRTQRDQAAWPLETAGPETLVQMAIVYEERRVTLLRDGRVIAAYPVEGLQPFGDDAMVLIGLRYVGQMGEVGQLEGQVAEARIYDRALTPAQIAALTPLSASSPPWAWWTFQDGRVEDRMGRFPVSQLRGSARIEHGRLVLDGDGFLWAARDARAIPPDVPPDDVFDHAPQSLFYKARSPLTGNMWDTWLYRHEGTCYLYYLANSRGRWDNFSLATSPDGVHWTEVGRILPKRRGVVWMGTGSTWRSPRYRTDGRYILNYSEWRGPRQTIFFAASRDLTHWEPLGDEHEFVQDERWYERNGRWDCIWTLPRPGGGLYGYWTATPKAETGGRFGFGESADGVTWKALPPPRVEGVGEGEVGAIERVGSRYVMLFGTGGHMVTLLADRPEGPFRAATKNREILSGHTYFARFFRFGRDLLVNHHSIARNGQVSMGLLKRASMDREGTFWLGWWRGNEALKHTPVPVPPCTAGEHASGASSRDGRLDPGVPSRTGRLDPGVSPLAERLDLHTGLVLEGRLTLPESDGVPPAGLWLGHGEGAGTALCVRAAGAVEIGPMRADGSGFAPDNRVTRERPFGQTARFRLLLKGSLLEFYLDDLLIQCYSLPANADGRIGLLTAGSRPTVHTLHAWKPDGKG